MPPRLSVLQTRWSPSYAPFRHDARFFHALSALRAGVPNHYETLGIEPNASQSTIKKQFYSLSKLHHPDRNPSDANASARFVAISDAYVTLKSPSKRAIYDRESGNGPRQTSSSHSYSSAAAYRTSDANGAWGARPASGLSKKRGTFHGPPPSFYRSGGWGAQGEKRQAGAAAASAAGAAAAAADAARDAAPGGQQERKNNDNATFHYDDDVPHFDRRQHFRRQEAADHRLRGRRKAERDRAERERDAVQRDSVLVRIILVGSVLGLAILMPQPWRTADRREGGLRGG